MNHRSLIGVALSLTLITGCKHYVSTHIAVQNYVPMAVQVKVTALDTEQNIVASPSIVVPAATAVRAPDGGVVLQPDGRPQLVPGVPDGGPIEFKVEAKGRIRFEYTPVGTNSSMPLPEDNVPNDDSQPFKITKLVPTITPFDSAGTYADLERIAETMGAKNQPLVGRLVDYLPRLSAAIVIDSQSKIIDLVQLATPPEFKFSAPMTVTRTVLLNKSLITNIKVAVPLYGSVESAFSDASLYKATVDVKHFPYENPFELSTSMQSADQVKLKALKAVIDANTGCKVRVIRGFRFIDAAVFALQRGTKRSASADSAVSSVLTSDAVYAFANEESSVNSLTQVVLNVDYSEWTCASVLTLLNAHLTGKLTQPKAAAFSSEVTKVSAPGEFSIAVKDFRKTR